MRKFLIGFVSLGAVLVVYLLYSRVSDTRVVDSGPGAEFTESAADSNVGDFDSEVGRIGDVGLGPVRKAKYIILDPKTKEVEREWGFEILRDEVGDIWGIDKPYVNIYRRNFKCYVTADKGQVQVETAVGRTTYFARGLKHRPGELCLSRQHYFSERKVAAIDSRSGRICFPGHPNERHRPGTYL
jgi:hypothetical protein